MDGATRTSTYMHSRPHDRSDFGGVQREESLSSSASSYPPVASSSSHRPSSPQQRAGQPPPSSLAHHQYRPSSTSNSNHYATSPGYSPMSRKADPRDSAPPAATPHRTSLPSIHDIVSGPPLPRAAPASLPPHPPANSFRSNSPYKSPKFQASTPRQEPQARPISPNGHYSYSQPPHGGQVRAGAEGSSRLATLHPINTASTSPRDDLHHSFSAPSYSYASRPQGYDHHRRSDPEDHTPYPYTSQAPVSAPAGPVLTAYPVASSSESGRQTAAWRSSESVDGRATSDRSRAYPSPYGETIKRELNRELHTEEDLVDAERCFAGILHGSDHLTNFGQTYIGRLRDAHPHDFLHCLPVIKELEELSREQEGIRFALERLKQHVIRQSNLQAERSREQDKRKRAVSPSADESRQLEHRNSGDSSGPDPKKRRGRAAPPGRCHSCNRIETPEWRRGPDGARTLCNACGLHYAKLNRKNAQGKSTNGATTTTPKKEKPSP